MLFSRVAVLAPPTSAKFLSYLTGWLTIWGWISATTLVAYFSGSLIQGLMIQNYPHLGTSNWQATLISYATICLAVFVNTVLAKALPSIEGVVFILHVFGMFAIIIPLVYLGPHISASGVFKHFVNEGGWQTTGLSFFVGLPTSMTSFIG